MNSILYICFVVAAALLAGSIVLCVRNRGEDVSLLCVKETPFTAVMALMIIAMGVWMVYLKLTYPTIAGEDRDSYLFVAVFSLLCHLMGNYCILFTFVKRIEVYDDYLEEVSIFGTHRIMRWNEIVKVEKPVTRKAFKLRAKDGSVITVTGTDKAFNEFAQIARDKIKSSQGKDLLNVVESRLRNNRL